MALAKAIEAGNHAQSLLDKPKKEPTAEWRSDLERRVAAGRAARRRFIESNLRPVVSVAKKHSVPGLGLSVTTEPTNAVTPFSFVNARSR